MVAVSNKKSPNQEDLKVCAENDKCVLDDRIPRWLKLRCISPVKGKYLLIVRKETPSKALSIAEIRVKDERNILINMRPGGI